MYVATEFSPSLNGNAEKKFLFSSSIAERNFGFGCLILKQTPFQVLLDLITMIKVDKSVFKTACLHILSEILHQKT